MAFNRIDKLTDMVAVVTGASCSLGAAVAEGLALRGAKVALLARSEAPLRQMSRQLGEKGYTAAAWSINVCNLDTVNKTFNEILDQWRQIDILINIAGAKREGTVEQTSWQAALDTMNVNYLGALACCKAVIPGMRQRSSGHIINVSSVLGKRATPERGVYSASKAALNALTDSLRVELTNTGIRVTLVCPGRLDESSSSRRSVFSITNRQAGNRIVRCVERPVREIVLTPAGRILTAMNAIAPSLVDRILSRVRHSSNEEADSSNLDKPRGEVHSL